MLCPFDERLEVRRESARLVFSCGVPLELWDSHARVLDHMLALKEFERAIKFCEINSCDVKPVIVAKVHSLLSSADLAQLERGDACMQAVEKTLSSQHCPRTVAAQTCIDLAHGMLQSRPHLQLAVLEIADMALCEELAEEPDLRAQKKLNEKLQVRHFFVFLILSIVNYHYLSFLGS